jgi:hypothetical protein
VESSYLETGKGAKRTRTSEAHSWLRPYGQTLPPAANLSPRDENVPWGWNSLFAPPFFQTLESVHPWGGGERRGEHSP